MIYISTLNLINNTLNEITTKIKGFEDLLNSKVNCFSTYRAYLRDP